ncbi:DUF4190 domain-containing protein [Bifidobacterium vansinderenii]|uniref:Uncharacterized protein n=1 Tax=Bifidobacterium vansinderenii TaxID=1984871 RepID=A0A229VZE5_9BIFI|nr:DUF4190 domain-containing protein [Bifidobacterium vansinderenii]OXN00988.1 hypothetical protein Tam10B_0945 [Bifidobacterium vansinderenii]
MVFPTPFPDNDHEHAYIHDDGMPNSVPSTDMPSTAPNEEQPFRHSSSTQYIAPQPVLQPAPQQPGMAAYAAAPTPNPRPWSVCSIISFAAAVPCMMTVWFVAGLFLEFRRHDSYTEYGTLEAIVVALLSFFLVPGCLLSLITGIIGVVSSRTPNQLTGLRPRGGWMAIVGIVLSLLVLGYVVLRVSGPFI